VRSGISVERDLGRNLISRHVTGGGFGGCTVNLIRPAAAANFALQITRAYRERFGLDPQIYPCRPAAGAEEINTERIFPPHFGPRARAGAGATSGCDKRWKKRCS
jgi:hypothetical protein